MSPFRRRIFLYWLLLLVSALVVGGVAIGLLRREQGRLMQRTVEAEATRRAAVEARARLVAENAELLAGDVENGLIEALTEAPTNALMDFLTRFEKANPLVRTTFVCNAEGLILKPSPDLNDENARGFRRRFSALFSQERPWTDVALQRQMPSVAKDDKLYDKAESAARMKVSSNVEQVQNARRDVQALSQAKSYSFNEVSAESDSLSAVKKEQVSSGAPTLSVQRDAPVIRAQAAPARRGWQAWTIDGRLHLIGWVQPAPGGDVRGVEVELTALVSRLGGALPVETGAGEGFVLRDDKGRVLHQAGAVTQGGGPVLRVPLSTRLLPGWEVLGFVETASGRDSSMGGDFVLIGILIIGFFVIAILSGGSLLLWQAQRSATEAQQKTSFVANVSHELKTPLTTIRLYSELLEQGRVKDEEKRIDYLRTIGRETQRLARLVNNVLDFSRLEQGRKKYSRETLDLTAELARMLDGQAPRLAEAGLEVRREFPDGKLEVGVDRDALEQVVLNLLDNACKYAAAGGEITVAVAQVADFQGAVEVRVMDRGPGVPDAHRERIFEKFHRVDDSLTASCAGAGLGLSIARGLAEGLGGSLRHEPREGGGSLFILRLG